MVDFITPLITAGYTLAEKIVFSWFEGGKADVRVSRLEDKIAELSALEAERLRVRRDDLAHITKSILAELITAAPELAFVKPRFHEPVLRLDYDPKNPDSSNQLLGELRQRLNLMAKERTSSSALNLQSDQPVTKTGSPGYKILPPSSESPNESAAGEKKSQSKSLLEELQRRIAERESPRS